MREATIKPLHHAILTLPDGKRVEVERLGRGRYTTAWANGKYVYLQTAEADSSKEILESLRGEHNPHIPECVHLGSFLGPFRLYRMPKYGRVTAKGTPEAWRQLRALMTLREDAIRLASKRQSPRNPWNGYTLNDAIRELIDNAPEGIPPVLAEAVRLLLDAAGNYGEYTMEFQRRNVAADREGRLILLDPLFDMAEVRKDRDASVRKARGW